MNIYVCSTACNSSFLSILPLSLILKEGIVHDGIILLNLLKHLLLTRLHYMAANDQLLKDKVGLVEVKD